MSAVVEIIKYEGDNSTFIWKHPCEDFNATSQLIVHQSQEAVLFMDGQALDLFGPGRHTLVTQNMPIGGKLFNRATGGKSPFHCEVYFINKTVQMALKWGTDSKIRYLDPNYGIPIEIGAYGEMNLAVSDSRKLLEKLVGTTRGIAWGETGVGFTKSIQNAFRPMISTAIKTHLPVTIKYNNINILEIDERLVDLSEILRTSMIENFEEYGLTIPQFYITGVALDESDPNVRRMKELHSAGFQTQVIRAETMVKSAEIEAQAELTAAHRRVTLEQQTTETEVAKFEAERQMIRAHTDAQAAKLAGFAVAEVMSAKGYNYIEVLNAEGMKYFGEGLGKSGGGSGSVAGEMMGIGAGFAFAKEMVPQFGDMFKGFASGTPGAPVAPAQSASATQTCTGCGAPLPENAKFSLECGTKVAPPIPEGMILCPSCGETVVKGKFCPECGYRFIIACPNCGKETVPGAKFCLECGCKL